MFWSKLCESTWISTWNLAFPVFIAPFVWNMCENLHYESVYFKELHNDHEYYWPTTYRAGAAVGSTITSLILVARFPVDWDCKTKTGFFELFIFLSCRSLDTAPHLQIVHSLATYFLRKGLAHSPRKCHSHHWTWLHQVHNDFSVRLNLQ